LLWLGLALCAATAVAGFRAAALTSQRRFRLVSCAAVVGILCGAFIAMQEQVLELLTVSKSEDAQVDIVAEYTSVFGNIKVLDLRSKSNRYPTVRAFLQDGIIQNRITGENISVSMYTYVLERLARTFSPEAESALVLGLGAGIVPRDMKRRGLEVTVVEINPDALKAAAQFGFDPDAIEVRVQDARTFVRDCGRRYDVVVVDLFQGDGTPDYLLTREFFADLRRCLPGNGIVVMNAFFDPVDEAPNRRLLATIAASFRQVFEFHVPGINAFVVATASSAPKDIAFSLKGVPPPLLEVVGKSLSSGRLVTRAMLRGYEPMTDQQNLFSILMAAAQMTIRKDLVANLPPRVLVN
jgi:predicted membrane-bound spermidine synthase